MRTARRVAALNQRRKKDAQNAEAEYQQAYDEAVAMLDEIKRGLEEHKRKAAEHPGNWGFTGDMQSFREPLRELRDRVTQSGEYTSNP